MPQNRKLGNRIAQGRKYSKIRLVLGSLQKSFACGRRLLGPKKLRGTASRSSRLMILLLFHLPAKGCSKSRSVKPGLLFTALHDIRRPNAAKSFQSSSSSVCIVMTDSDPSINKQQQKKGHHFVVTHFGPNCVPYATKEQLSWGLLFWIDWKLLF